MAKLVGYTGFIRKIDTFHLKCMIFPMKGEAIMRRHRIILHIAFDMIYAVAHNITHSHEFSQCSKLVDCNIVTNALIVFNQCYFRWYSVDRLSVSCISGKETCDYALLYRSKAFQGV